MLNHAATDILTWVSFTCQLMLLWQLGPVWGRVLKQPQPAKRPRQPAEPLTEVAACPVCVAEQSQAGQATEPGEPPPRLEFKRGRPRQIDTSRHDCPQFGRRFVMRPTLTPSAAMAIKITYCTECDYEPLAEKLAAAIRSRFGLATHLEAGHDGIYQVSLGDHVVYNNLERGGQLPTAEEIFQLIEDNQAAAAKGDSPVFRRAEKLTVLNPMGYPPQIQPLSMAPRLETLEGQTIYLVDARFDDSDRFLAQMQHWFAEHLPRTQTRLVSKSGVYTEDDPALFAEIKAQGGAMIMGVGH
jgi:selT/selW/selH-like putative selenoprotein